VIEFRCLENVFYSKAITMTMDMSNVNTNSSSGGMEMVMTFSDLDEYKVTILWDGWDVETKVQYAFSWIFVVFLCIVYHASRWLITSMEDEMRYCRDAKYEHLIQNNNSTGEQKRSIDSMLIESRLLYGVNPKLLKVYHSIAAGLQYGLALLLMLISMTYNSGLFLALMIGYGIGDFLFIDKILSSRKGNTQYICH
jgi:hypothetical protein